MALRWLNSLFTGKTQRFNIYREYCRSINLEQRLNENPYFDKYANKIAEMQKVSPEKFREMSSEKFKPSVKRVEEITEEVKSSGMSEKIPRFHGQKDLNQIMKLETLEDKSASEVETIWKQYHQSKQGLYAVLPKEAYAELYSKLQQYPVFVLPLPRAQGYEFMMLQFQEHSCHFTSLLNFQAFKENAPVSLTITYFTELIDKKGIVLMRGEYDDNSLKVHEAQCLANQLQLYYGSKDGKKENLLWTFNKKTRVLQTYGFNFKF